MSKTLEEERDDLRRQVRGYQEMLFQAIDSLGEPIVIPKEKLKQDSTRDKALAIIDEGEFFVLKIESIDEQ